ncbi:CotH kinase family protein [Haloferula sp. BvORR071]|uniref:CotH kinase family protein n=1 Tax=Haloferula sp. BvORR071 TaxID=1396141 RepID=UPI00055978D6|nr:CotH kinase family protein [Haloferula sp. BvORR071]
MTFCKSVASLAYALVLLSPVLAAPVTIGDFSFEGNTLTAGQFSYNKGPEWQETNGPNNGAGFEEYIVGFAADGTDHLGMELNHNVWQDLAVTYQANTRYTLTIAAGRRSGNTNAANQTQYLLADSTGTVYATGIYNASALPLQSFGDAPALVFDTPNNPAAVGKTVRILLQARGVGRSHFDNIRLDATSLTPAGTATLANQAPSAVTATTATLNGQVTVIGNSVPSITLFWGPSDGGPSAAGWANSLALPGTYSGSYSGGITGLTPGATCFFTARATNSAGDSWAPLSSSFEAQPLAPTVANISASGIVPKAATVGAQVNSTGGEAPTITIYYGTADGGTNAGAWTSSVALGEVATSATTTLGSLTPGSTYYFRALATNGGGSAWAPSTASFATPAVALPGVQNRAADGITSTTGTLRGEVTQTGGDAPAVTIYYGTADGGTNPAAWASSTSMGPQSGNFSVFAAGLSPQTTYYFRSKASNAAGTVWAPDTASFSTTAPTVDTVVINEIHFKPADKTSLEEFIELHNPGGAAVNLSGWTLSDAVTFTIPGGTVLPAGGYAIVAENPAVILSKYGKTALGPWTGKLNSTGEQIDLRDGGGVLRDRVGYGVGFPWPTGADGSGASAELVNPALDNDLGGSWRSSGTALATPVTYIASQATGWKYKKGTAEASNPVEAWRATAYNDSAWLTGQAGIGYGDAGINTTLSDMRNAYNSVYFRKSFTVPADAIPKQLKLRVLLDDGCVIWINGSPVHKINVAEGQLAYNYLAPQNHEAVWEEVTLNNTDAYLLGGTNVIAVHAFNTSAGSSDFSMDLELKSGGSSGSAPTPGAANTVLTPLTSIPPQIRQVEHLPVTPAAGQAVTITARITDPDGMGAVSLAYQTVDPGAYIRLTDAAYTTSWTTVPMYDNGSNGDATANDSIYTAVLPAAVQTNRRLVRYRVNFADAQGNSATVPYADDEQPNFAYYVYNGLPAWQGAFRPGTTPLQTFEPSMLDDLPVYTLIANGTDVINSQYNGGSDAVRFRATFVYNGVVYDHIEFKNRGEASTYVSGKNKWRFFFNRARDLPAANNLGEDYKETWGSFSGDACASPWAALHRGCAGIEEASSYKIFQLGGLPSPNTHYYQFRVVRGATETPPPASIINDPIGNTYGQYTGDFWGLYLAVEQPDGSFLDERGLPDGSIYKIENNAGDKKNQGITQPVDSSDWNTFRDAHVNADPTEAWWRANMDMESYYTFHALNRLTGNVDVRGGYNHYFYHRSSDNRWVPMPWDLDMMFIAKSHHVTSVAGGSYPGVIHAYKSILQNPALALEYRNRAREIVDLLASDSTTSGGQFGQLINEFAQIVNPTGQALTWADADAAMWNLHPRTQGTDGSAGGQTEHKGNFFKTSFADSRIGGGWTRWLRSPASSGTMEHEDLVVYFRDYVANTWPGGTWAVNNGNQLGYGYQYVANDAADPLIPSKPVATATGDPSFPVNDLVFTSSAFADPQGVGTYARTKWRLAEISAPGVPGYVAGSPLKYEIDSTIWTSESTSSPGAVTVPFGIAQVGKTYRLRVRHQDSSGRWSSWSAPVQFTATAPPPGKLMHYWNFNEANYLVPTQTIGGGQLSSTVSNGAEVIQHGAQDQGFAGLNARNGDEVGMHLRVNNPLGATLNLAVPTTGHNNIVIQYETRRSGQGAGTQVISYTTDGSSYQPFTTINPVDGDPTVQILDFRSLTAVNDNPLFAVRIAFQQGSGGTGGNNRFDNLTVEGNELPTVPGTYANWRAEEFPNPADQANDAISGPEANPSGDGVPNLLRYAMGVGPYEPVQHLLPVLTGAAGGREFRFRFDPSLTDLRWRVLASNDLGDWTHVLFDSNSSTIPPLEDGWLPVEVPAYLGIGPEADVKIFTRLNVELVP